MGRTVVVARHGSSQALREFLDRFRRPAAVPAEVSDEVVRELGPVFEALDSLQQEAAVLQHEAECRRSDEQLTVATEIERRLAAGRESADRVRRAIVEEARRNTESEAAELRARARAEAGRLRERGRSRIPDLANSIVGCVLEDCR